MLGSMVMGVVTRRRFVLTLALVVVAAAIAPICAAACCTPSRAAQAMASMPCCQDPSGPAMKSAETPACATECIVRANDAAVAAAPRIIVPAVHALPVVAPIAIAIHDVAMARDTGQPHPSSAPVHVLNSVFRI